ncbi:MAG: Cu(I)-responsive transcriptional regulator [Devosiaceae bacterium]
MNIGHVAQRTDLPAKTIRYYEEIGLVTPARAANGYRAYSEDDAHRLAFLQRARRLGFSIEECRQLLSLYDDKHRAACDVKALALEKLAQIDRKLEEMHALRDTLASLAESCAGDDRPNCPIINDMAGHRAP